MRSDDVQTNLRMPADLKDRLQEAAKVAGRTLTAEVVHRLETSFVGRVPMAGSEGDEWARMRVLRHRHSMLSAEKANLQRTRDELAAIAPKDRNGEVAEGTARTQLWEIWSRIYELDKELHHSERSMDELYDQLAGTAPGVGRL